ncbi:hypothetical protein [Streptomyces prunicolor]|uniref:Uncharacterized protein n=1 Tax=Streptomyces prunicolor TaxID=67348 RepID=A0ABU4FKA9_9ACTN|nr:hypothetical protein [Streptomyces prunicolor]MDV7221022.1 hypothetical protein [Streptomyces prunicolor]
MKRVLFGAVLGLLVAYPTLLAVVLAVIAAAVSQPAVLAFAAGVLLWPRLTRTVRRWAG